MKIAFFDFNNNFGGAPRGSLSLANRLNERGATVRVFDAYGQCDDYIEQIKKYQLDYDVFNPKSKHRVIGGKNIGRRLLNFALQIPDLTQIVFRLRNSIKKNKLDLLWVNNKKSLFFATLATFGLNVKVVLYYRGWGTDKEFDSVFKFLVQNKCSALIGHSKATVSRLKLMFPSLKTTYVPNSVDYDLTQQSEVSRLQGKESIKILLPAARPVLEKGHLVAVKALKKLSESYEEKKFELIFPGKVPVGTSSKFINELYSFIDDSNLQEKVHFIGWKDSLKDTILDSDIVILPSHTEGFPRVIIEAMLLNRPVIATPVGGIPEAITDGVSGYIVPIDSHLELVNKIEMLFQDDSNLINLVENAYLHAKSEFCPKRQADIVFDVFKDTINNYEIRTFN